MRTIDTILNVLFPRKCTGCGKLGYYICAVCKDKLKKVKFPICPMCTSPAVGGKTHPRCRTRYTIDGLACAYDFSGAVQKAIKLLKYKRVRDIVPTLSALTTQELLYSPNQDYLPIKHFIGKQPIMIPVPLHWFRTRRRWFNQSKLLANRLGAELGLKINSDLLIRTKHTVPQAGKLKNDRLTNIKGAFMINPNARSLMPKRVILVDDVWTTGATMREAANVLKRAGVKMLWGMTVAR